MYESSLEFLRCLRCGSKIELEILKLDKEIHEGFLICCLCDLIFPIIAKIPIFWNDFSNFLSTHKILSGRLYRLSETTKMKNFIKTSLIKTTFSDNDRTNLDDRWSKIYQNSQNSKFYSIIKNNLNSISKSKMVLEYGCSIGIMTSYLSNHQNTVFGIDKSFSALEYAKQKSRKNSDFFLADFLSPIFGKLNFDLILALNILELIEPTSLLKQVSNQIKSGYFVISDPYDFDRGKNSVKKSLDESSLRNYLTKLGFSISSSTKKPSYIKWNLKLNSRSQLNYKVDLVIGKKNR